MTNVDRPKILEHIRQLIDEAEKRTSDSDNPVTNYWIGQIEQHYPGGVKKAILDMALSPSKVLMEINGDIAFRLRGQALVRHLRDLTRYRPASLTGEWVKWEDVEACADALAALLTDESTK